MKPLRVAKTDNLIKEYELDKKMTYELEAEGYSREICRVIQDLRKKSGLVKKNKIELIIECDSFLEGIFKKYQKFIQDRTNSKKIEIITTAKLVKERFKNNIEFNIKDKRGNVYLREVK